MLGLLNVIDDGIIIIDTNGQISTFNEKALTIVGGNYDLIDANISDIIPDLNLSVL